MYIPKHFEFSSSTQYVQLVREYPLATVITPDVRTGSAAAPWVDPIPLLLETGFEAGTHADHERQDDLSTWCLTGHVARANPVWQQWQQAGEAGLAVVAVFRGPDCYISPSWYASKQQDHRAVPTWNYIQLNFYGRARAVQSSIWLEQRIAALTRQEEAGFVRPWSLADADPAYVQQLLRAVVGLELKVERVEAKAKLSQNQPAPNYASVCAELTAAEARQRAVLEWMLRQRPLPVENLPGLGHLDE